MRQETAVSGFHALEIVVLISPIVWFVVSAWPSDPQHVEQVQEHNPL